MTTGKRILCSVNLRVIVMSQSYVIPFFGIFPEGFKEWRATNKTTPCYDRESGVVIMETWYWVGYLRKQRYFHRSKSGSWTALGYKRGWHDTYTWRTVSSPHEDEILEQRMIEQCQELANLENAARDCAGGKLIPEVLHYLAIPAEHKTKTTTAEARTAQAAWAAAVIAIAGGRCNVTGSRLGLEACHIKPFADCTVTEAYSLTNGVCLTATAHRMLDNGSLSTSNDDPFSALLDMEAVSALLMRKKELEHVDMVG
jgi:hypothetical protein